MKPQTRRVLRDLQAAGAQGVHSHAFRADFVGDPSKRVCELRELGFDIEARPEKRGSSMGRRYILRASNGTPAAPLGEVSEAGGAERPGGSTPFPSPGLASKGDSASAGSPGLSTPRGAAPVRYPAQTMKQWSTEPDEREGWCRVRDFDGRWYWELTEPLPAQRELAA